MNAREGALSKCPTVDSLCMFVPRRFDSFPQADFGFIVCPVDVIEIVLTSMDPSEMSYYATFALVLCYIRVLSSV